MSQAKYWTFTLNNYTEEEVLFYSNLINPTSAFAYIAFGKEVGEEGTPHLQGHLELRKKLRLRNLKELLTGREHLEVRKGSFERNEEYVSKEGDVSRFGERVSRGNGHRSDLDALAERIRTGDNRRSLAEEFASDFIRYANGIDRYFEIFERRNIEIYNGPWPWNVTVPEDKSLILWGDAGIGKTEYAKYLLPNALFVSHMDDLRLYSAEYDGIIFDDMCFLHMPRTAQIHLVDIDNIRSIHIRYRTAVLPAHTKRIFLTNERHGAIFNISDPAINRRVEIIHLE